MTRLAHSHTVQRIAAGLAIIAGMLLFTHTPALAQGVQDGLNSVGTTIGLSATDPRVIVARVINAVLGLLGIITVSLMLYAGFLWMTAGGEGEKVERAQKIIKNCIIGLIIILSSWAITSFVISKLLESTNGNGGGISESGGGPGGGGFGGVGSASTFQVRSIVPSGSTPIRNVEVRFVFTQSVDPVTVASAVQVLQAGSPVAGRVTVDGSLVTFVPDAACPTPHADRHCFDADTDYRAKVSNALRSVTGQRLACGSLASACEQIFHTGSIVDTTPPTVSLLEPLDGTSVPADTAIGAAADAADDAGVSLLELSLDGTRVDTVSPPGSPTSVRAARMSFDTHGLPLLSVHTLLVTASDVDSNTTRSRESSVIVRAAHCFDGAQNGGETGVDCGGSDCGACTGGACTRGTDCAGGVCGAGGVCVELPTITSFSPRDGKAGTFVTVFGRNFGRTPGRVTFADNRAATAPAECSGSATWTQDEVLVTVPDGAVTGAIKLENATSHLSDVSNDPQGPDAGVFTVNFVGRPGLCMATPGHGLSGASVLFTGTTLGSSDSSQLFFTDRQVTTLSGWTDSAISLLTPTWQPGGYAVSVSSSGIVSNAVLYRIDEPVVMAAPIIDSITPPAGPIGEYLTIQGRNLGDRVGSVIVERGGVEGVADLAFPAACGTGFWKNDTVIFKMPRSIGPLSTAVAAGEYHVRIRRVGDSRESNILPFTVNTDPPNPGVCAIEPTGGPESTLVTVSGERFTTGGLFRFSAPGGLTVNADVSPGSWTDTQVQGRVPHGAVTGRVDLQVGSRTSNPGLFQVNNCHDDPGMCRGGRICCASGACSDDHGICPAVSVNAHYAWQISTGAIPINPQVIEECNATSVPSPAPWANRPGGDNVCVNTMLTVRFNVHLDPRTVNTGSVIVTKCTATGADPCATTEVVAGRDSMRSIPLLLSASTDQDYLQFLPATAWEASTTYRVVLRTSIRSSVDAGNLPMLPKTSCGAGNAYCFTFKTKSDTTPCVAGSATVTPSPEVATELGAGIDYSALARAAGDACLVLDGSSLPWSWYTAHHDGRASISTTLGPAGFQSYLQVGTPLAETIPDPVLIHADVVQPGLAPVEGIGELTIHPTPPVVTAHGPDCNAACTNAAVWARFNVPMDPASFTADTVVIRRCATENCRAYMGAPVSGVTYRLSAPPGSPTALNSFLVVEGAPYLDVGGYYRVTLKPRYRSGGGADRVGIRSMTHLALTGANSAEGFTWVFRVKSDALTAACAVGSVAVTPSEKYESVIGARQLMTAVPSGSPDECSATGQILVSATSDYAWDVADTHVARLYPLSRPGTIDTTFTLPPRCSGTCLKLGSDGPVGTPRCGDSIVQRPWEECDLGSSNGPTGLCSSDCLWNPQPAVTATPAGTCGNGVVDARGEQCDPGLHCIAGPSAGAECTTTSDCGTGGTCGVAAAHGCSATCQALGAVEGRSTCGDGVVSDGETCDDSNTRDGDGCSSLCLHEGSTQVTSLCGNGTLEPGEECERVGTTGPWPRPGCDQNTCLLTGTNACSGSVTTNCCGNGVADPGEIPACDTAIGVHAPGCTDRCLLAGSSISYATPSFCGDGIVGTGEECEVAGGGGGDGHVDNRQLAEIVGMSPVDPSGRMQTNVNATTGGRTGTAVYGLQCGYTDESQCPGGFGLTDGGCCAPRPSRPAKYPTPLSTDVCRNVEISATFDAPMNESSIRENMVLAEAYRTATACPAGTHSVGPIAVVREPGFIGWIKDVAHRLVSWLRGEEAIAGVWCASETPGTVSLQVNGTKAVYAISSVLRENTTYRVILYGNADLPAALAGHRHVASHMGIRTGYGVDALPDVIVDDSQGVYTWTFTTGRAVCAANQITIQDTVPADAGQPFFFSRQTESHPFSATVNTIHNGAVVPITPVADYSWSWQPWISSDPTVIQTGTAAGATTAVNARDKNGNALVTASIRIDADTVEVPSAVGNTVSGSHQVNVLLCEHPWPTIDQAPFHDDVYHFSTLYCRDAPAGGSASAPTTGPAPLLPALNVNQSPTNAADLARGIERQYIFTFADPALRGDGIGIRLVANPLHLSPASWYNAQGFNGSPSPMVVDGYQALRDGTTVYVAGTNVDQSSDRSVNAVSSTIYIISVNSDARPETLNIFQQMLQNWTFNRDILGASNVCVNDGTNAPIIENGQPVRCSADWECLTRGTPGITQHCASLKAKLQRNERRVSDFQDMIVGLEHVKTEQRTYPMLSVGSFVQTMSNSRWPSWQQGLGTAIGGTIPVDPVNRFMSCGQCQRGSDVFGSCVTDNDCGENAHCIGINGFDPQTCWKAEVSSYQCPAGTTSFQRSRVYGYRAVNGGSRYELATELEGVTASQYRPALITEIKRCSASGAFCTTNSDCTAGQTCAATGGRWKYQDVCSDSGNTVEYGASTVCGDGVIGPGELCELGDTHPMSCTLTGGAAGTKYQVCSDCRAWVDGPATACIANNLCGNGRIDGNRCSSSVGVGFRQGQACTTNADCVDSRDRGVTISCVPPTGGVETCDDGSLNGTYGHCNASCTGYAGVCGDNMVSGGEVCDNGVSNGAYCGAGCSPTASCASDCRGPAPYCGDGHVTDGEQCEPGQTQRAPGAICRDGANAERPCTIDADCGTGGHCGGTSPNYQSCATVTVRTCAGPGKICSVSRASCNTDTDCGTGGVCVVRSSVACSGADTQCGTDGFGRCVERATEHVRSCIPTTGGPNQCMWSAPGTPNWSACQAQGSCGDGVVDPGEQCDDANTNNNDGCTNQCTTNTCGDGVLQPGVEECDLGSRNGMTLPAEYGSTVISCSRECRQIASSGGFCGDNVVNGAERCDGTVRPGTTTCVAQGYDYPMNVSCVHDAFVLSADNQVLCQGSDCCVDDRGFASRFVSAGGLGTRFCAPVGGTTGSGTARMFDASASPEVIPSIARTSCHAPVQEALSCTPSLCTFAGCGSCATDPGHGVIRGQVFDAVYSNQPVPNARVTLALRGQNIAETFTDPDGRFSFEHVNERPECAAYRVTVDSYVDNDCTDVPNGAGVAHHRPNCNGAPGLSEKIDESTNGGYWSYETDQFTLASWGSGYTDHIAKFYMAPRVGLNETMVIHTWDGNNKGRYFDAHLILPIPHAYAPGTFVPCTYGGATPCVRDVSYADGNQGRLPLTSYPGANLYCIEASTGRLGSCFSFNLAPQTMKYLRPEGGMGYYSFYLNDWGVDGNTAGSASSSFALRGLNTVIRIVTYDRVYTVRPPTTQPSCGGKYWQVFQQDAFNGYITVGGGGHGVFQCPGAEMGNGQGPLPPATGSTPASPLIPGV